MTCIWCKQTSLETDFLNEAHILPQSLGSKRICENVCDECNAYFGASDTGKPSIDEAVKEVFNLTKKLMLDNTKFLQPNYFQKWRYKSRYFRFSKNGLKEKPQFRRQVGFRSELVKQFKRGIYKIYLEENEERTGSSLDSKFDWIRSFARYQEGNIPVYYFQRKFIAIKTYPVLINHPVTYWAPDFDHLFSSDSWFEFEILSHVFSFPLIKTYTLVDHIDLPLSSRCKSMHFMKRPLLIRRITDIDIMHLRAHKNAEKMQWSS